MSSTPSVEDFFNNTGGGVGAPSASLKIIGDVIYGEVVDQALVDAKKFGTDEIERDKFTNEPIKQLVVVLQTEHRNWTHVAKVPKNEDGSDRAASEDDGRRAVYVKPFTNIHASIGEAIVKATGAKGPILNGAKLGVKIVDLKDTGKGNPLKIHAAVYEPPVASGGDFFNGGGEQYAAPQPPQPQEQVQPAAPAQPAPQAPAAQPVAPPAQPAAQGQGQQVDPWSGQPASSTPPF